MPRSLIAWHICFSTQIYHRHRNDPVDGRLSKPLAVRQILHRRPVQRRDFPRQHARSLPILRTCRPSSKRFHMPLRSCGVWAKPSVILCHLENVLGRSGSADAASVVAVYNSNCDTVTGGAAASTSQAGIMDSPNVLFLNSCSLR